MRNFFPFSTNHFLYQYIYIFFGLPMEVYKPALFLQTFSQTPLLPSSLFQGLIENFPRVGLEEAQDV